MWKLGDIFRQVQINLTKTTSEPSMVRASHQLSEGCGFDPRLGLKNYFSDFNLSLMNI